MAQHDEYLSLHCSKATMGYVSTGTGDCYSCTTRVSDGFAARAFRPKPFTDLLRSNFNICLSHRLGMSLFENVLMLNSPGFCGCSHPAGGNLSHSASAPVGTATAIL